MKNKFFILAILIVTVSCNNIFAQERGTKFENISLKEALAKATKNGGKAPKLVFVDCYTQWCGPCKKMAKQVFPLPVMGDFFNANFINLKIDVEKGEGIEIAKRYNISAFPTFLILKANGEEVNRIVGASEADRFIEKVKFAMDQNNSPVSFKAKYIANPTFNSAMEYLRAMDSGNFDYSADISEMYYKFPDRDRFNKEFFDLLINSIISPINPIIDDIIINKWIANNWAGRDNVDNKLKEIYNGYLGRIMMGLTLDVATVEETVEAAKAVSYYCSDPKMAQSHYGTIALFIVKNDVEGFLNYITNDLVEVPVSERSNLLDTFQFISKKATDEQRERFKKYMSEIEKTVESEAGSMKRAIVDYERIVMNK